MFSFVGIVSLIGITTLSSLQSSYIRLEASRSLVESGSQFSIDVYANAQVPVNTVYVKLNLDADYVEVIGIDREQSILTIWTEEPIINNDNVTLRGSTYRKGFLGEQKIATINLRAKKAGPSLVTIEDVVLLTRDDKGKSVNVSGPGQSRLNLYIYDENTNPNNLATKADFLNITDLDGDGKVTSKDISLFVGAWISESSMYDFSGDGKMSFKDFSVILSDFLLKIDWHK